MSSKREKWERQANTAGSHTSHKLLFCSCCARKKTWRTQHLSIAMHYFCCGMVTLLSSIFVSRITAFTPSSSRHFIAHHRPKLSQAFMSAQPSVGDGLTNTTHTSTDDEPKVPLYLAEGMFSVEKPSNWTSSDVVSYLRGTWKKLLLYLDTHYSCWLEPYYSMISQVHSHTTESSLSCDRQRFSNPDFYIVFSFVSGILERVSIGEYFVCDACYAGFGILYSV